VGQQQLLLIVLGVIVVGLAILVGIALFNANSVESSRDQMIAESVNIGQIALKYYRTSKYHGGGQNSFTGWVIPENLRKSSFGEFLKNVKDKEVTITGTGYESNANGFIKIETTIKSDTLYTKILN
jgi:hypothetical protein